MEHDKVLDEILLLGYLVFLAAAAVAFIYLYYDDLVQLKTQLSAFGHFWWRCRKSLAADPADTWLRDEMEMERRQRARIWLGLQAAGFIMLSSFWAVRAYKGIADMSLPYSLLLQSMFAFAFLFVPLTGFRVDLMYTASMGTVIMSTFLKDHEVSAIMYVISNCLYIGYGWTLVSSRKAALGLLVIAACSFIANPRLVNSGDEDVHSSTPTSCLGPEPTLFVEFVNCLVCFWVVMWSHSTVRARLLERLRHHSVQSEATSSCCLLQALSDVVLHLDKDFCVLDGKTEHLADLLMGGQAAVAAISQHAQLTTFMSDEDRARFTTFVSRRWMAAQVPCDDENACDMAEVIHLHIRDVTGVPIAVDVFHKPMRDLLTGTCHLVGLRKSGDSSHVAMCPGTARGNDAVGGPPPAAAAATFPWSPLPSVIGSLASSSSGALSQDDDSGSDLPGVVLRFQAFGDTVILREFHALYLQPGDTPDMIEHMCPDISEMMEAAEQVAFGTWFNNYITLYAEGGVDPQSHLQDVEFKCYVPCIGHVVASKAQVCVLAEIEPGLPLQMDLKLAGTMLKARKEVVQVGSKKLKRTEYRRPDGALTRMQRVDAAASAVPPPQQQAPPPEAPSPAPEPMSVHHHHL
eukprot:TRINITY_DN11575_c0_g1_i2.p1 TRINITY_DN11575_c0_g1~~TRINITY_DN11575_c0_g1_i2.p1  ORF type:complete len:631 (+),score=107.68 TRINITY_DN11575_c0_g1_i2:94-1986(+)